MQVGEARPAESACQSALALAMPALRRARKRVEEIAIATKTALVQVENGQVVRVHPGAQPEQRTAR